MANKGNNKTMLHHHYSMEEVQNLGELRQVYNFSNYYVNDKGQVFRKLDNGYMYERYSKIGVFAFESTINFVTRHISVLVYETFIGEVPAGYCVRHKDGNKQNNAVSNLYIDKIPLKSKCVQITRLSDSKVLKFKSITECYNHFVENEGYFLTYDGFYKQLYQNKLNGYFVDSIGG